MAAAEIIEALLRVNLAAAAAILLVLALRKLVRPRFGARLAYSLWLLPVLAGVAVLAPARQIVVAAPAATAGPGAVPALAPFAAPIEAAATLDPLVLVVGLWLAGVIAAGLVMAHLQNRFTAEVRKGAIGPAVVGVIAPRIVTPRDFGEKFSGEEQTLVLAHERAHIARQDSRLNGLSAAIQCLCWFNPIIHLAAHLMRIDQELACDEAVVTRFPEARRAYAQALVKAQLTIRPLPLGCYWPSGTEHPLMERIAMLKLDDFSRTRRLAGASALALLGAATSLAAWAAQPADVRFAALEPALTGALQTPMVAVPIMIDGPVPTDRFQLAQAQPAAPVQEALTPYQEGLKAILSPEDFAVARNLPEGQASAALAATGRWINQTAVNQSLIDNGTPATVEGTITRVEWVNPAALIHVRDNAGQEWTISSETPNRLFQSGGTREGMAPGTPIKVDGYASGACAESCKMFARPAAMTSNGAPLFPKAAEYRSGLVEPARGASAQGAPEQYSPITNSVVREGATPPGSR